ncbi:MAG: hypothetical protein QNL62_17525 [Gammaproteobacteria bacterium]|nr:hypothetical protein [Gammaproteobacteria bacterium]
MVEIQLLSRINLISCLLKINDLAAMIRELASQNEEEKWDEIVSSHEDKKLISGFNNKIATSKTNT